jgi:hypothetical protein
MPFCAKGMELAKKSPYSLKIQDGQRNNIISPSSQGPSKLNGFIKAHKQLRKLQ